MQPSSLFLAGEQGPFSGVPFSPAPSSWAADHLRGPVAEDAIRCAHGADNLERMADIVGKQLTGNQCLPQHCTREPA